MTRRQTLEDSARLLRIRIQDLENKKHQGLSEKDRPAHEVAERALRDELTNVGQQLRRYV